MTLVFFVLVFISLVLYVKSKLKSKFSTGNVSYHKVNFSSHQGVSNWFRYKNFYTLIYKADNEICPAVFYLNFCRLILSDVTVNNPNSDLC